MYRVYLIKNKVNNKKYIGITAKTLQQRFKSHIASSKHKDTLLYKAMRKYGYENFSIELLEDNIPLEKGAERECYWIAYFDTYKHGYNMTTGGHGTVGYIFTEDVKQKMRDAWCYEKIITPERNKKLSESMKGKNFSSEHRRKISEQAKQRTGDKNPFYGKKHSEKTKNKVSDANTKHAVLMLDKDTHAILKEFKNAHYAAEWIVQNIRPESKENTVRGAITRHCLGIADGQTAYGYRWKYKE